MPNYVLLEEFKERFPTITGMDDDDLITSAITAASLSVDAYCGRRFYSDSTASTRTYAPIAPDHVDVDDFSTATGLVIVTDENSDGIYEQAWAVTDYVCEPVNGKRGGLEGLPFDRISVATDTDRFFPSTGRYTVQVTAQWGWAAVPEAVRQATLLKAAALYRRKDSPDGVLGGSDFSVTRISRYEDPHFVSLLHPYRNFGATGVAVG